MSSMEPPTDTKNEETGHDTTNESHKPIPTPMPTQSSDNPEGDSVPKETQSSTVHTTALPPPKEEQPFVPKHRRHIFLCACCVCGQRDIHDHMRCLFPPQCKYVCKECVKYAGADVGPNDHLTMDAIRAGLAQRYKFFGGQMVKGHRMRQFLDHSKANEWVARNSKPIDALSEVVDFSAQDPHACNVWDMRRHYWHMPRVCDSKNCRNIITRASGAYSRDKTGYEMFRCNFCDQDVQNANKRVGRTPCTERPRTPGIFHVTCSYEIPMDAASKHLCIKQMNGNASEWERVDDLVPIHVPAPCRETANVMRVEGLLRTSYDEFQTDRIPNVSWQYVGKVPHPCDLCIEDPHEGFLGTPNKHIPSNETFWFCTKHGLRYRQGPYQDGQEFTPNPELQPHANTNANAGSPNPTPNNASEMTNEPDTPDRSTQTKRTYDTMSGNTTEPTANANNEPVQATPPSEPQVYGMHGYVNEPRTSELMSLDEWANSSDAAMISYSAGDSPPDFVDPD